MERLKTMAILALLAALAGSIALAATDGEAEVRITARQLEDGRVEFGLQQRVDGEWGERVLPRSRYFPTDATANRWLNSTPVTLSVSVAGELTEEPTTSTTSQSLSIRTQAGQGITPGGAFWDVRFDDFTDERQAAVIAPTESDSSIYEPRLAFLCSGNGTKFEAWFADLPVSDVNSRYTATIRWDSTTPQTATVREYGNRQHAIDNPEQYRINVTNHDTLRVRFTGFVDTVTATLDVSAMRDAPTWPNILACGS